MAVSTRANQAPLGRGRRERSLGQAQPALRSQGLPDVWGSAGLRRSRAADQRAVSRGTSAITLLPAPEGGIRAEPIVTANADQRVACPRRSAHTNIDAPMAGLSPEPGPGG